MNFKLVLETKHQRLVLETEDITSSLMTSTPFGQFYFILLSSGNPKLLLPNFVSSVGSNKDLAVHIRNANFQQNTRYS